MNPSNNFVDTSSIAPLLMGTIEQTPGHTDEAGAPSKEPLLPFVVATVPRSLASNPIQKSFTYDIPPQVQVEDSCNYSCCRNRSQEDCVHDSSEVCSVSDLAVSLYEETAQDLANVASEQPSVVPTEKETPKRDQSRLLLVSLIEHLCAMCSPSGAGPLFTFLCNKLADMGIINKADISKQMKPLRRMYSEAFSSLVIEASLSLSKLSAASKFGAQNSRLPAAEVKIRSLAAQKRSFSQPDLATSGRNRISTNYYAESDSKLSAFIDVHPSRYLEDFSEIAALGRGGFGSVWHVRHNLDGKEYAVKKIPLDPHRQVKVALREAKVLASMESPNIVRYHSAWLELMGENCKSSHLEESSFTSEEEFSSSVSSEARYSSESAPLSRQMVLFIQMELCKSTLSEYLQNRNLHSSTPHLMAECMHIFKSLLVAVAYIHKRGLGHRDLTPKNIFLVPRRDAPQSGSARRCASSSSVLLCDFLNVASLDDVIVKVGDFGLVTEQEPDSSSASLQMHQSTPFGTPLYSPPELRSRFATLCSGSPASRESSGSFDQRVSATERKSDLPFYHPTKCDVYSLGVILLELLYPFKTSMERAEILGALRYQRVPPDFAEKYPKISEIVLWLTEKEPEKRPTPEAILDRFSNSGFNDSCSVFSSKIVCCGETCAKIKNLVNSLAEKDKIIAKLQAEIQGYKIQLASVSK